MSPPERLLAYIGGISRAPAGSSAGMASHFWKASPGAHEVPRLRHAIREYAAEQGLAHPVVEDVALAVTEVVTNSVIHAFPETADGEIIVMATVNGNEVTVRVVDDGVGLRPRLDSPGAGLGLAIAGTIADRIVVEHPERGGTEVRMTFATTA